MSASTSVAEEQIPSVDLAEDTQDPERRGPEPKRPWYSGWCGAGPTCNDERQRDAGGALIRRCRYRTENGAKAAIRFLYCACLCHQDPKRAGQAVVDDPPGF